MITFKKDKLKVELFNSTLEMAEKAAADVASKIVELLKVNETINMIFAAAPSQTEFLKRLIEHDEIEWGRINAFHMDEYIGLPPDAPQRFGNFLENALFSSVPLKNVFYLDGNKTINAECKRYAELLKKYPPHIVCLGIGENGHIAFNDPHVAKFNDKKVVKLVTLDNICRKQQVDDKCFNRIEDVPTQALTLTIPTLLQGEYMYCIVPYKTKADAIYRTLNEEISEKCPASILRTQDNTFLYLDNDSSALLNLNKK
ncbi:MAG: glucosamine-6-phosphate deaminase [Phocaeicola sp.]|uniref:glucosamine-6-phosphate deaminase n=1 Tax=Phocaeicola TaxID=909656 RepID=UPI00234F3F27|nr:glucosamine-6-phosphate deaminase [Phocaeicola oris]MCE2616918.1 glucosamine-6-phosphate deaminase [Phocaeicola oris]